MSKGRCRWVATKSLWIKEDAPGWQQNLFEEERCPWVATKYLWRREIPLSGNKNHRLIDSNMLSGWRWYQIVKSEQKGLFHNWLELNYQDLKRSVKGGSCSNRLEKIWKRKISTCVTKLNHSVGLATKSSMSPHLRCFNVYFDEVHPVRNLTITLYNYT